MLYFPDHVLSGSCGKMDIRCPDGTCLTPRQRCDGVAQCSDKRDEPLTCGTYRTPFLAVIRFEVFD